MKKTMVISAFPCSGKTYAFENNQNRYSMLDSDSSQFSWVKDKDGNNTKERNPDFPNNYIKHIKDNLGKIDIIFVSSHLQVRQAMDIAKIKYYTVYPKETMLNEWIGRMYRRGSNESFIKFQIEHWDEFTQMIDCEPHGETIFKLGNNEYIDLDFICKMIDFGGAEMKECNYNICPFVKNGECDVLPCNSCLSK